jgi:hypothetical protein
LWPPGRKTPGSKGEEEDVGADEFEEFVPWSALILVAVLVLQGA